MGEIGAAAAAAVCKKKRFVGIVLIFCTACIWIISSFISESLVTASASGPAQVPPFLLTYLATTLFTLYLPLVHGRSLLLEWWRSRALQQSTRRQQYALVPTSSPALSQPAAASLLPLGVNGVSGAQLSPSKLQHHQAGEAELSAQAWKAALWATPFWFLAQYTFNLSLSMTSVTSNTIISSVSPLFTFALSVVLLGERFTLRRLVCIASCIAGTVLVTLSDTEAAPSPPAAPAEGVSPAPHGPSWQGPLAGDLLVVVSAGFYGAYTVLMRLHLPGEEAEAGVALFFGYVGLLTTVCLAPLVVAAMGLGVINVGAIPRSVYGIILLEGLLDYVLSDYLWARAVMLIGPTVATLALSVQIPLAAGAELMVKGAGSQGWTSTPTTILMTLGGTAFILAGFFGSTTGPTAPGEGADGLPGHEGVGPEGVLHSNLLGGQGGRGAGGRHGSQEGGRGGWGGFGGRGKKDKDSGAEETDDRGSGDGWGWGWAGGVERTAPMPDLSAVQPHLIHHSHMGGTGIAATSGQTSIAGAGQLHVSRALGVVAGRGARDGPGVADTSHTSAATPAPHSTGRLSIERRKDFSLEDADSLEFITPSPPPPHMPHAPHAASRLPHPHVAAGHVGEGGRASGGGRPVGWQAVRGSV